jgi:parvulin-like peptidyl-prolyl isomerase
LDFLINLWGFDRKAAYAMLDKKEGSFYEPASIYKGYAVFKVLQIRKADIQDYDQARKEQYLERVTSIKKHRMFKEWKSNMVEAANIEVYLDGQRSSFASPQDTSAKDTERKRSAVTGHTKEESDGGE